MSTIVFVRFFLLDYARNPVNLVLLVESGVFALCWCMYLRAVASYAGSGGAAISAIILLVLQFALLLVALVMQVSDEPMRGPIFSGPMAMIGVVAILVLQSLVIGLTRSGLTDFLLRALRDRR